MMLRPALPVCILANLLAGCASHETKAPCGRVLAYVNAGDPCGPMQPVNLPFEGLPVDPVTTTGANATRAEKPSE